MARFDSDPGHPAAGDDSNLIVLGGASDGDVYSDVEINGTLITMLVDTGASGVALSEEDAHRVGIATTIGMSEHIGQGAGGAVFGDVVPDRQCPARVRGDFKSQGCRSSRRADAAPGPEFPAALRLGRNRRRPDDLTLGVPHLDFAPTAI